MQASTPQTEMDLQIGKISIIEGCSVFNQPNAREAIHKPKPSGFTALSVRKIFFFSLSRLKVRKTMRVDEKETIKIRYLLFLVYLKIICCNREKNNDKEADKPSIPSTRLIEFTTTLNTNKEKSY